jgi:4'-phosphopantetheinyl transferase
MGMNEPIYWLSRNADDVPGDDDWLSAGERAVLSGMRFAKRRNDWRLGRWTAKRALSVRLPEHGRSLSSLEIRAAADGAPEVFVENAPGQFAISISHSSGRSLCALGPPACALGCDLERLEMREESLARDYFAPEEISFCAQAPDQAAALTLIWSAKESTLKALRVGLRRDTKSILILPIDCSSPDTSWKPWTGHCLESSRVFYGWWCSDTEFIYTLASDRITASPEELMI